jgi:hypothetical protein
MRIEIGVAVGAPPSIMAAILALDLLRSGNA